MNGIQVFSTPTALGDLERAPKTTQHQITEQLAAYANTAHPLTFARPTGYHGFYRFRIAGWPVIAEPRGQLLIVHIIDRRKGVYRRLV